MESIPPYFIRATGTRRVCASFITFLFAGLASLAGSVAAAQSFELTALDIRGRAWTIVFLTALWMLYLLQKKSLGAMVCLLEIRQLNGAPPSFRQIFIRSAPVFILAVVWHFPTDVLPQWAIAGWTFVFLALVLANLVNGVLGVIKGVSLLDRLTQTVVLQVKVPPHAVPNVVGTRLF